MIDLVSLTLRAGDGGDGKVSFRRAKYVLKGGPDGGHGGDGGDVILVGTRHLNTLKHLAGKKEILASVGQRGGRRQKTGERGEDVVLQVPLGTVVWLEADNPSSQHRRAKYGPEHALTRGEVPHHTYAVGTEGAAPPARNFEPVEPVTPRLRLVEITQEGQTVVACQGGFGGRGNMAFKSSVNTTPLMAEYGTPGEVKQVTLELKLLADIGLVGYPNAGKSTLLAKLTRANPKTADYPFTTLEPNLGVLHLSDQRDLVLADIPGLIEGSGQGKGLGHDFLRHIENCRALLFVLFLEENVVSDSQLTDQAKAKQVWDQYQQVRQELQQYQPELLQKPSIVALNKTDLYSGDLLKAIQTVFESHNTTLHAISGFTGQGIPTLSQAVDILVQSSSQKL